MILPKHNEADLDDVPQTVREQIEFILVDTMDEVLRAALAPADDLPGDDNGLQNAGEMGESVAVA